jgi:single-strand DNA-binding protein
MSGNQTEIGTDIPEVLSNLAVIRGRVTSEPSARGLPAGGIVVQFDVVTRVEAGGRAVNVSVPIAWNDPAESARAPITSGTEIVVVGTVRRRFFRVGGATQSRTEVVADTVLPTRRRKPVAAALGKAARRIDRSAS